MQDAKQMEKLFLETKKLLERGRNPLALGAHMQLLHPPSVSPGVHSIRIDKR